MAHHAKVLVARRDPDACKALVQDLQGCGYDAHGLLNGLSSMSCLDSTFDVVIIDLSLPRKDCIRILREVLRCCAGAVRIMLASPDSKDAALEMLNHGAQFLMEQPFSVKEATNAISRLLAERGERFSAEIQRVCRDRLNAMSLEERERHIIVCLLRGQPIKDIGAQFGMLEGSTKNFISRIYKKIGIASRNELFRLIFCVRSSNPCSVLMP